jgi:hypothetical protein
MNKKIFVIRNAQLPLNYPKSKKKLEKSSFFRIVGGVLKDFFFGHLRTSGDTFDVFRIFGDIIKNKGNLDTFQMSYFNVLKYLKLPEM